MSGQDTNVEKLDVQEAKKASYGVNAEIAEPTGVQAAVPGGVALYMLDDTHTHTRQSSSKSSSSHAHNS